jgi:hypothetical protein
MTENVESMPENVDRHLFSITLAFVQNNEWDSLAESGDQELGHVLATAAAHPIKTCSLLLKDLHVLVVHVFLQLFEHSLLCYAVLTCMCASDGYCSNIPFQS